MTKSKKTYLVIWLLLVALFNVICFVTPEEMAGMSKYAGGFWPGYGFITLTFLIHLIFTWKMFDAEGREQKILNMPVIVISFIEVLLMAVAGGLCMALPFVAYWVGIIICAVILVLSIVFSITAMAVTEKTYAANCQLNERVELFRDITGEAEILKKKSAGKEAEACAHKIIEALKYSDPLTDEKLIDEELRIQSKIREMAELIGDEHKTETVKAITDELLVMIEQRNIKMKAYKRSRI